MKKTVLFLGCISLINAIANPPRALELQEPLYRQASQEFTIQPAQPNRFKKILQDYPSSRKLALFTVAAIVHVGSLTINSVQACTEDQCRRTEAADWLTLIPTLANMGSTCVSLYDEHLRVLKNRKLLDSANNV